MGEEVKKKINPNHQMLFTAPDGWGYFWAGALFVVQLAKSLVKNALTPEWEKRSKKKKKNATIRCCSQHLIVGVIFWLGYNL